MAKITVAPVLLFIMGQTWLLSSCKEEISAPVNSLSRIEIEVIKIAKDKNIPSLEVAINTESDSVNFAYSHPDVERQEVYGVGSTTKLLAAILIFKLIEEDKLDLDDFITEYIDSVDHIENIQRVTVRNLLNHTSGLSDYSKHPTWIQRIIDEDPPINFEQKILLVDSSLSNTGTFSYSNTNYLFLEKAVESITNQPFHTVFDDFYSDLGLPNIKMGNANPNLQSFFAQTAESSQSAAKWKEHHGFAGSAYADPKELNRFLHKLLVAKTILADSAISLMKEWVTIQPAAIPIGAGSIGEYGNGLMKLQYHGQEYIGHYGDTLKYQSFVFFNEKTQTSISVTTNCSGQYYNNIFFQELIPKIIDGKYDEDTTR